MRRLQAVWVVLSIGSSTRGTAAPCSESLHRAEIIRCALSESLDVRAARQELKVLAGRRRTAGVLLPANPTLSGAVAARIAGPGDPRGTALNWQVVLAQEVEVAGQRGARVAGVDAELAAQSRRIDAAERTVAANALRAYYDALSARELRGLFVETAELAAALGRFAEGRAKESLLAPVDADLLRAEATRVSLLRFDAERRERASMIVLATTLGVDPTVPLELPGTLESEAPRPLESTLSIEALTLRALAARSDLAAAAVERQVFEHQVALFRRARIPNLTFSAFAERDEFDQQVYGGGLSLPIPLPSPLGRTYSGELAESRARVEKAEIARAQVERRIRLEVAQASTEERARAAALRAFAPELLARAHADLAALRDGLATHQLSVRDALLAQRSLLELLLANLEARAAYAQARVELARAAALPLGEAP